MAFAATGMTPSKVSSTTIFQVSSVSKAISATVAAIAMTKDHSFDWDTSVGKAWDRFRPNLDYVSGDATIGDSSFLAPACVRRRAASSRISAPSQADRRAAADRSARADLGLSAVAVAADRRRVRAIE